MRLKELSVCMCMRLWSSKTGSAKRPPGTVARCKLHTYPEEVRPLQNEIKRVRRQLEIGV